MHEYCLQSKPGKTGELPGKWCGNADVRPERVPRVPQRAQFGVCPIESKEIAWVYIACLDMQQMKGAGDDKGVEMHLEMLGSLWGYRTRLLITELLLVSRIWDAVH